MRWGGSLRERRRWALRWRRARVERRWISVLLLIYMCNIEEVRSHSSKCESAPPWRIGSCAAEVPDFTGVSSASQKRLAESLAVVQAVSGQKQCARRTI